MQESENSAGESQQPDTADTGESQSTQSQIEEIASLLNPEPEAKADDKGESDTKGESQEKGIPKTVNDLAEKLGIEVTDLYGLEFKMSETGESRTLGQMKDIAATADQIEVDKLTFEESKTKREKEFVRAQSELSELINMLPKKAVTPELLQVLAKKRVAIDERESRLTLTAIPEWIDSDVQTKERGDMQKHLTAYGFSESYLDSVQDHKTLKYIRDNMQREARIERVLAQVKQVNKPGHKPSGKPSIPAKKAPQRRGPRSQTQQVEAVAKLLTGTD